jgi:hypothetical protein
LKSNITAAAFNNTTLNSSAPPIQATVSILGAQMTVTPTIPLVSGNTYEIQLTTPTPYLNNVTDISGDVFYMGNLDAIVP